MIDMHNPFPIARLIRWWRHWTPSDAARAELDALGPQDIQALGRDIGASGAELRALAGKWPDSADLLAPRMAALYLDPGEIGRTEPAVSRDLVKHSSLCGEKRQCSRNLDAVG